MKTAAPNKKPSSTDTPTKKPVDNGKKSKMKKEDKQYHADEPQNENIAKKRENEEQPVR